MLPKFIHSYKASDILAAAHSFLNVRLHAHSPIWYLYDEHSKPMLLNIVAAL